MEFEVRDDPDPLDFDVIDTEIRSVASATLGLGEERELSVLVHDDGALRAGIVGWTWGDGCELHSLWVDPELRGGGLGFRLLTEAQAEALRRGCKQIVIFVYDFQPISLYQRFGFEEVARVQNFPTGADALWMRKTIDGSAPRDL